MKGKIKRIFSSATAIVTAIAILLTGTLAWYAGSSAVNAFRDSGGTTPPIEAGDTGANLHDHFGDPGVGGTIDKNVFVENTGLNDVFVRIKLSERLDNDVWVLHQPKGGSVASHLDSRFTWAMGNSTAYPYRSIKDSTQWTSSSALNGNKSHLIADALGFAKEALGPSGEGVIVKTGGSPTNKSTQLAQVVTMAAYKAMTVEARRAFVGWVYDVDGYAYWSQPLAPGAATGLLLDSVTVPTKGTATYEYDIKVDMEYVDITDLGAWTDGDVIKEGPKEGGTVDKASPDGKDLLEFIAVSGFSFDIREIVLNIGEAYPSVPVAKDTETGATVTVERWTNSNPSVVDVNAATGAISAAKAVGETIVTGIIGDKSATYKITVRSNLQVGDGDEDEEILRDADGNIIGAKMSIKVGEERTIPTIKNSSGTVITPASLTWTGLDANIATFDESTGLVRGIKVGTIRIVGAHASGNSATIEIDVAAADARDLSVADKDKEVTLEVGETHEAPKVYDEDGVEVEDTITWEVDPESENPNVVEIDSNGNITAKEPGKVTIIGDDGQGNKVDYEVIVKDDLTAGNPEELEDLSGHGGELGARGIIVPLGDTVAPPIIRGLNGIVPATNFAWTTEDASKVTVSASNGRVTGVAVTTTPVTITGTDANDNKVKFLVVVVAKGFTTSHGNAVVELDIDESRNAPTVYDGSTVVPASTITWRIAPETSSVVELNTTSGRIVAKNPGTVTIIGKDTYGNEASYTVRVKNKLNADDGSLEDIPAIEGGGRGIVVPLGDTVNPPTIRGLDGVISATEFSWSRPASASDKVTVNATNGRVTGIGLTEGTPVIVTGTHRISTDTVTFRVAVVEKRLTTSQTGSLVLDIGDTRPAPTVYDGPHTPANEVTIASWRTASNSSDVVEVNATTGVIVAKGPGEVIIIGRDAAGNEARYTVIVRDELKTGDDDDDDLEDLSEYGYTGRGMVIRLGDTVNMPIINGYNSEITPDKLNWIMTPAGKVTMTMVTEGGKVVGKLTGVEKTAPGVPVTIDGKDIGERNEVRFLVIVLEKEFTLDGEEKAINIGGTGDAPKVYDGAKTPANEVNVTWTIDTSKGNPDAVTIDGNGKITAQETGTATIVGADSDGNTVSYDVTVTNVFDPEEDTVSVQKDKAVDIPEIRDAQGKVVELDRLTWTTTDNTKVEVDGGKIKGLEATAPASVTITGTDNRGNKVEIDVIITAPDAKDLEVIEPLPQGTLNVGGTYEATDVPVVIVEGDTTENPVPIVRWESGNQAIATVGETNGLVTAVAVGTVTIRGFDIDNNLVTYNVTVTNKMPSPEPVGVDRDADAAIPAIVDVQGNTIASTALTWTSSAPTIAVVNTTTGKIDGLLKGTATLRGTDSVTENYVEIIVEVDDLDISVKLEKAINPDVLENGYRPPNTYLHQDYIAETCKIGDNQGLGPAGDDKFQIIPYYVRFEDPNFLNGSNDGTGGWEDNFAQIPKSKLLSDDPDVAEYVANVELVGRDIPEGSVKQWYMAMHGGPFDMEKNVYVYNLPNYHTYFRSGLSRRYNPAEPVTAIYTDPVTGDTAEIQIEVKVQFEGTIIYSPDYLPGGKYVHLMLP